jgi:hypothetical protein
MEIVSNLSLNCASFIDKMINLVIKDDKGFITPKSSSKESQDEDELRPTKL